MDEAIKESVLFEIFRVGTWHGIDYNKDHLDEIVENFKKGDPKVPLIIGHNSFWGGEEKPAHGWVSSLKRTGNRLLARARNVSEELMAAVNDERFPMRSVELWRDYQGRGLALGAIAFLGGSNPEVGGMADFNFSKESAEEPGYMMQAKDGSRICFAYGSTERLVALSGQGSKKMQHNTTEGGESNMNEAEIKQAIAEGIAAGIEQFKASPEIVNLQAENQRLRNEAIASAVESDLKECQTFAKGLLDAKKVTPALFNAGLGAFLASLDNSTVLEFSAGKKQTARAFAKEMLEGQAGHGQLFNAVDTDGARPNEDTNVMVEQFAAKHGLDPKIVADNWAKFSRQGAVPETDEEGRLVQSGKGVSLIQ